MGQFDKHRVVKYVQQSDVDPPILVTIEKVQEDNVAPDNQAVEIKYIIHFLENVKPWVPGFQMLTMIHHINGSGDTDDWPGTKIVLFKDPSVMYGGKMVGGIRCRAPKTAVHPEADPAPSASPSKPLQDDDIPF